VTADAFPLTRALSLPIIYTPRVVLWYLALVLPWSGSSSLHPFPDFLLLVPLLLGVIFPPLSNMLIPGHCTMGRRTIYPVHCWSWYASLSSPSPRFPDYPRRLSTRQTIHPGLQILPISFTIGICGMRFPLPSHIFTWLSTPSLRSYTTRNPSSRSQHTILGGESVIWGTLWPFCDVRVRLFIFFSLVGCKSYRLHLHTAHLLEKSASMSLKDLGSSVFFSLALSIFIFAFVAWKKIKILMAFAISSLRPHWSYELT